MAKKVAETELKAKSLKVEADAEKSRIKSEAKLSK